LGLHAAVTAGATAAVASACDCQFGRGLSFGLSFERLCSLGDDKERKYKRKQAYSESGKKCTKKKKRASA
jgi:hypothetical protein